MNNKKSQIGLREFLVTLVIAGILAIVGVMVFSKVSSTTENIFDRDTITVANESITITTTTGSTVNESITITSGTGNVVSRSVIGVSYFGNVTMGTHITDIDFGDEINWTRSGTILVSTYNFSGASPYNISYTYAANGTGTTAHGPASTEDVTTVTYFGNVTISTDITGIEIDDEINWTVAGIITPSTQNFSGGTYNISYTYESDTDAMLTKDTIEDTVLDSFELAVIALIILAAVVILGTLFMLGSK